MDEDEVYCKRCAAPLSNLVLLALAVDLGCRMHPHPLSCGGIEGQEHDFSFKADLDETGKS